MQKDEAYSILDLNHGADKSEIKKAYRRAASKYHPDRHHDKGEEEHKKHEAKFKEVKLAYEVLTGKVKEPQPQRNNSYSGFNGFFSQMREEERQAAMNGSNAGQKMAVDVGTCISGGKVEVDISIFKICDACNGNRIVLNKIKDGSTRQEMCKKCGAEGLTVTQKTILLTIPKGAVHGSKIKIEGKGGPRRSPEGKDGDLYITIIHKHDDYFFNNHHGLCARAVVSIDTWLMGGIVNVATPVGSVTVTVPALIPPDKLLRIHGKGMGGNDFFVSIVIDSNYSNDSNAQAIIKELGRSLKDRQINRDVIDYEYQTKNKLKELSV
ncbi:MAG: hypothetical protein DRQ78_06610 [Epsilonproteobacteria bacterium]|nr:MAG: hypothetical protein DRQ78_06610 [Campylobacterota bacterium]